MKSQQLIQFFENLNLPNNAAKLYLAALELGPCSIQNLAKKASISRMNAYDLVELLTKQGLIEQEIKTRGRIIHALPPKRLIGLLVNEQEKLHKLTKKAEGILPDLESLFKEEETRPRIRYFDGLDGIKQVYQDTLTADKQILAFSAWHEMVPHLKKYYDEYYIAERLKRNIAINILSVDTPEAREYEHRSKTELRKQKYVSQEYDFALEINIYNNKVAICSFKDEMFGLIIESRQITQAMKMIFKVIWNLV